MVNNLGFRWPKAICFMVLVAHGTYHMFFHVLGAPLNPTGDLWS